jgi:hypothetical protein
MKGGIHFTKPLPSNDRRDKHTDTLMGGIYEVAVEMGFRCHDIHTKFSKIGSGIKELIGRIHRHREHGDRISLFLFFPNKESRREKAGNLDQLNGSR